MHILESEARTLVSEPYFTRGRQYLKDGLIDFKKIEDAKVTARAAGSFLYEITLIPKNNKLSGTCSCPAFSDFGPCKHIAATGLALIKHNQGGYRPSKQYQESQQRHDLISEFLNKKTKQQLIKLILQLSQESEDLKYMLEEYATL